MNLTGWISAARVKWLARGAESLAYSLKSAFESPERALLLCPWKPSGDTAFEKFLSEMAALFAGCRFCLVAESSEAASGLSDNLKLAVLSPSAAESRRGGQVARSFVEKLRRWDAPILIDLGLEKRLFNACVALSSGAPVRIAAQGNWGAPCYNLEIRPQVANSQAELLRSYLEVFRSVRFGSHTAKGM